MITCSQECLWRYTKQAGPPLTSYWPAGRQAVLHPVSVAGLGDIAQSNPMLQVPSSLKTSTVAAMALGGHQQYLTPQFPHKIMLPMCNLLWILLVLSREQLWVTQLHVQGKVVLPRVMPLFSLEHLVCLSLRVAVSIPNLLALTGVHFSNFQVLVNVALHPSYNWWVPVLWKGQLSNVPFLCSEPFLGMTWDVPTEDDKVPVTECLKFCEDLCAIFTTLPLE